MSLSLSALDGRVELRELVGAGGMGEVHAAWDQGLRRAVAVKFVRGSGPADAERLLLEARLQARVEHPHVVRVFEVGTLAGRPCIVFQLVPGRTLQELAPELSVADRVDLVRQAAKGLHAAHLQGLVHRDVKPGNILVEETEKEGGGRTLTALVTDFGLAHAEEGGLTRSGVLPGTLDFMAPEQLAGSGPVDFRSDVYALGATLYAVLSGRPPFRIPSAKPDPDEQVKLLRRILDDEAPPLRTAAPDLPRELSVIAARAMEKDPGARYPSAEAFADDLDRFQKGEPIRATPPTLADRALKWSRRNRAAARSIAAALAILLAAGAFALWQSRQAGREALEAARLGAEAEQMHELLRVEMLLPAHSLTEAYGRVRGMLVPLASRALEALSGPAAFTLGRGRQLLGDHAAAYPALLRAWDQGFRGPEAALALAETESRLYARELVAMGRIDDPERKKARLAELARRFRDPAAARLGSLSGASLADRSLLAARLALVEQRYADAARCARDAGMAGADPVEAGELEGEALLLAGNDLRERGDLEGARRPLAEAEAALQRAATVGRSAPGPRLLLARARVVAYDIGANQGFRLAPLDAIAALLAEAEALDPAGAEVHNVWSGVEKRRGDAVSAAGGDPVPALEASVAHAERAVAASPSDPRLSLVQLANGAHALALEVGDRGADPRPPLARGIAAAERALGVDPALGGAIFNLTQLRGARAQWLSPRGEDARPDAEAAVAAGRRFLALGDRPVAGRVVLAKALESLSFARWLMGEDGDAPLAEGIGLLQEAFRLSPGNWGVLEKGISLAVSQAERALAEGRPVEPALAAGAPWAAALLPLAAGNVYFASHVGTFEVLRARAEAQAGRDPTPAIEKALPLLRGAADSQAATRETLGEAELARARWGAAKGLDPSPALRRAETHAVAARKLDPGDADAPLLEARALMALPHPTAAELGRARAALDRSLGLNPRQGLAWLADGRLRLLQGDRQGAAGALERAAAAQPRLAGIAELRAALAQAGGGK